MRYSSLFLAICSAVVLYAETVPIITCKSPGITCDYLVICPDELVSCGKVLAGYRNSSTFDDVEHAMPVSLSTIYQEFPVDDTCPRGYSIWYALKYAKEHWNESPEYVVLLGDDSVEVNGFDTLSPPPKSVGLMPTIYYDATTVKNRIDTTGLDTLFNYSDFLYLTINDTIPPLYREDNCYHLRYSSEKPFPFSIGRIPVSSVGQCLVYLDKLVSYEHSTASGSCFNHIVLAADDAMQGEKLDPAAGYRPHQSSNDMLADSCFRGCFTSKIYLSSFTKTLSGNHEQGRVHFFDAFNKGVRAAVYFGHGHPDSLSDEGFLRASDTSLFTNDTFPSIFYSFSCSNGEFLRKNRQQMCKSFLLTSRGGCVAYVAATVETYAHSNERLAKQIFSGFDTSAARSIGNVLSDALHYLDDPSQRYYHVLGDPALRFTKNHIESKSAGTYEPDGDYTLSTVVTVPASTPINYRYQISIRDSVTCRDGISPKYLDDSLLASFEGVATGGTITTTVARSFVTASTHYTLYAWSDNAEFRLDTIIPASEKIIAGKAPCTAVSLASFSRGVLTISLPSPFASKVLPLSLYSLSGALIQTVEIPVVNRRAVLDVKKIHLSRGNYLFASTAEEYRVSGKICLVESR